jgi:ABC-type proline/glycine betaine transport system permease subunit
MTARPTSTLVGTGGVAPSRAQRRGWTALAAIEVGLAALAVLADLLVPTVLMLGLAGVSLLVRHQGLGSLGLVRLPRPGRSALHIGVLTLLWSAVVLALLLPVLQRLTGERQDLSSFAEL